MSFPIRKPQKALRRVLRRLPILPMERRLAMERWLRGREEYRQLQAADFAIVSFGKAGRTWVRVMVSRFFHRKYGLEGFELLVFDNLNRLEPAIPRLLFSHDSYAKFYTGNLDTKADYYDKPVVLLVRDPRDVVVSQYFQWKYRMNVEKMPLNKYPPREAEVSPFEFAMNPDVGLGHIIGFHNLWARELDKVASHVMVRYEDLRADTERHLAEILAFLGQDADRDLVRDAVEFASIENMRAMEQDNTRDDGAGRVKAKDLGNPDSFKVRRAKVGGWRDYFDEEQAGVIDEMVRRDLDPVFGYGVPAAGPSSAAAARAVR